MNMKYRKWTFLNTAVYSVLRVVLRPFLSNSFRYEKYNPRVKNYIVLSNHNGPNDQYYLGLFFKKPMRFVASEHLFRKGLFSKILVLLANPIPRKKGAGSGDTVEMIKKTLDSGVNVWLSAEGNRSYSGETGFISPRTADLVRDSGCAMITFRFEGGYLKSPRWAEHVRKGKISGHVIGEYTSDEIKNMSDDELFSVIKSDLYVNAFDAQRASPVEYKGEKLAESAETVLFVCPECKNISSMHSHDDILECSCGYKVKYNTFGFFEGEKLIFDNTLDWDRWQRDYLMKNISVFENTRDNPITCDGGELLFDASGGKTVLSDSGTLSVYGDRLVFSGKEEHIWMLSEIKSMAMTLRSNLLFSTEDGYYEIKNKSRASAYKYLIFYRFLTGRDFI